MNRIRLLLTVLLLQAAGASGVISSSTVGLPPAEQAFRFSRIGGETLAVVSSEQPIIPVQSSAIDMGNFSTVDDLRWLLETGFQQQDFLDVDQAFKLRIQAIQKNKIMAVFEIADGYYLYRDKITFSNDGENRINRVALPAGTVKEDEYFGEVTVFNSDFSFPVELSVPDDGPDDDLNNLIIHANYQGCAEDGICYAPVNKSFDITGLTVIPVAQASHQTTSGQTTSRLNAEIFKDQAAAIEAAESTSRGGDQYTDQYTDMEVSFVARLPLLLGALFAGILLTFTPCVLPMIPILSSIIAGQGNNLTKTKGGILATTYVLGTVVTYAGMGALAGATGDQLQAYFQNIWAIGVLSALFFIMALSMFGLFEIRIPEFIQSKVQAKTRSMSGSIPLVFLLGLGSALVLGACISPVLISFLGIAVTTGDPLLGAQLMMVMAVGMGLPLIALGFGAGHFIPRAGKWMVKIKQGFGVMLIAVAIYLLGILPQVPVLLLWGSFFIILSIFLGATQKIPAQEIHERASNWQRIEKGLGIILLVWGIFLIAGGLFGQRDILRPLPPNLLYSISGTARFAEQSTSQSTHHQFVRVSNNDELDQQLVRARAQNKLVLIDYYADWCVDCIRMEKTTFANPQVKAVLDEKFITVQIDVTDPQDIDNRALKQRFDVFGPPATLFIDRDGTPLKQMNFYGYMESDEFLSLITEL